MFQKHRLHRKLQLHKNHQLHQKLRKLKVGSSVGQVPRQSPKRTGPTIPFGCPRVKDPNDLWFGLMPGHSIPSGHPASGKSIPLSTLTPVKQPVGRPRREEPFQPFKGIEEQDLNPGGATGPGPSRDTGTPRGIWLCTPTHGPGASLEELQLKEMLCDLTRYQEDLPKVYEKVDVYCKLR